MAGCHTRLCWVEDLVPVSIAEDLELVEPEMCEADVPVEDTLFLRVRDHRLVRLDLPVIPAAHQVVVCRRLHPASAARLRASQPLPVHCPPLARHAQAHVIAVAGAARSGGRVEHVAHLGNGRISRHLGTLFRSGDLHPLRPGVYHPAECVADVVRATGSGAARCLRPVGIQYELRVPIQQKVKLLEAVLAEHHGAAVDATTFAHHGFWLLPAGPRADDTIFVLVVILRCTVARGPEREAVGPDRPWRQWLHMRQVPCLTDLPSDNGMRHGATEAA
mmetsp:Transcript_86758/g.280906  ORF Transcript_86758/g.280906 Transcript_86758/m.280906 type:complete len:276 (-) Transcript_86758:412-1239(-)